MDNKKRHIGFMLDREMYDKVRYIADYNGQSVNGTIRYLLRQLIDLFEKEHSEIILKSEDD